MEIQTPPETYRQWLDCLQYLNDHPGDRQVLALLKNGKMSGPPSEQFIARVSDTVSLLLSHCCRRFLRQVDESLAEGDMDSVSILAMRFRKHANMCLFYRELTFLPKQTAELLDKGYSEQLQTFWNNFMHQVRISARESMDVRVEDMAHELSRIKILTEWRHTVP